MMQRLDYVLSRNLNSPFGKQDAFFETFVIPPEDFDTIPETNEIERIKYTFVLCKSGVEVFDKYEKEEPAPNEFKVFYEEDSPDKSNFFGTACRVKMSKEARDFFIRISGKNQVVNFRGIIYDYLNLNGFNEFVKNLAKDRNLNYTLLKGAIYLEIAEQSEINKVYKKIFSANNQLADWLKGGIEAIEKWKFTDENYDYEKHFLNIRNSNPVNPSGYQPYTYKPILPIPAFMTYSDSITGNNRQNIVDKGLSKLSGFVEYFEEISTAVVYNIVRATPDITDDIFFAIVFYVKNLIEDYIPESIKNVYNKLKIIFKQVLASVKQIANFIKEKVGIELAKMNAFLCGILNGLISLGQVIILLLAMVVDNIPFLENEKTSLVELAKHQEKLEFIEDFVDLFAENSTKILEGITSLFSDNKIWKGVSEFLSGLKKKFLSLNEYFWAYFLGAVVFELILDAVIAYFTGGSSLVAELSAKISRVTKQAEQLGAKGLNFSKNLGKKVATTADDLLRWLRKEFEELIEAIKGGEFSKYLKNKFSKLLGESVLKLEQYEVRILVRKATQNGSAKKVMLGKYVEGSPLSYNARAGKDHTFFEMKDELWQEVSQKVNKDRAEIWKINKQFIDEQFKKGKDFYLSHNPENQLGFYADEIDHLTITLKGKIIKINEDLWKIEF
ncbi:MAG: hypothetical protein E2590_15940 [Chryseobacterium sp.]|nr:hypothetical protein [Chryseobacterium sp.]